MNRSFLLLGEDWQINEHISIRQPTVREIIRFGEQDYFQMVAALTCVPYDVKVALNKLGLDWNSVSELECFMLMGAQLPKEQTAILLGDVDLSKLKPYKNNADELCLADEDSGLVIDKLVHRKLIDAVCAMHGNEPRRNILAGDEYARNAMLEYDQLMMLMAADNGFESQFAPLIPFIANNPGGKYSYSEVVDMRLYTFFDCARWLIEEDQRQPLLYGCYGGMIDTSKLNKKKLDALHGAS